MVFWEHRRLPHRRVSWLPVGQSGVRQVIARCPCTQRWFSPGLLLVVPKQALACRGSVSFSLEGRNLGRAFSITVADCRVGDMPERSLIERLSRQFCPRMPLHALTSDLHLLIILRLPGFVLQLVRTVPLS